MQEDLRESVPDLDIEIIGMNHFREGLGNEDISAGRSIPWLQDGDLDQDNVSDNWLTSWPFVYRDVVIVDANNIAVDAFNLTLHSLEEEDSYATLRQRLIDVAIGAIETKDDTVAVVAGTQADIDPLGNDEGVARLELTSVSGAEHGTAEVVTVEYPATLDSTERYVPDLMLSEIVPGEYIELYNSLYTDIPLAGVSQLIVSGPNSASVASLAGGQTIPGRGYTQIDWPANMEASWDAGEFVLFHDDLSGFEDPDKIDDFVAWGTTAEDSHIELAVTAGKWTGIPDGPLDEGAIQRIPGTLGIEVHAYDNHRPSTPGNAINDAVETQQVIRYVAKDDTVATETLTYTVVDYQGTEDTGTVTVAVSGAARPWQNPVNQYDINNDGIVNPQDALAVINFLSARFYEPLPTTMIAPFIPSPFLDCDGDTFVGPLDALLVINALNGAGEQAAAGYVVTQSMELDLPQVDQRDSAVSDPDQHPVGAIEAPVVPIAESTSRQQHRRSSAQPANVTRDQQVSRSERSLDEVLVDAALAETQVPTYSVAVL